MTQDELWAQLSAAAPKAQKIDAGVKGYLTVKLAGEDLVKAVTWLKQHGFDYLDMITAVDYSSPVEVKGFVFDPNPNHFLPEGATPQIEAPTKTPGFTYRDAMEVVYCLSSLKDRLKVFIKVEVPRAAASVQSLVALFKAADWQEREVFDLLGVRFEGHPNLSKILTPEFIQGHPLRKDYVHVPDKFD
ncbi:MAG: NADH-quinone oxidoreductase subunit C [Elusimicrobia bacterium]|nr:NADH-quinone oxidoreductase subunit C [Elusimicrobiota bacterium]